MIYRITKHKRDILSKIQVAHGRGEERGCINITKVVFERSTPKVILNTFLFIKKLIRCMENFMTIENQLIPSR